MTFTRSSLSIALTVSLMAGCGGGESSDTSAAQAFVNASDQFDDDHLQVETEAFGAPQNPAARAALFSISEQPAARPMPSMGVVPNGSVNAAKRGEWSAPFDTGLIAIHLNVLSDGSLMYFGGEAGTTKYNPQTLKFATLRSGEMFVDYPAAFSVASFCAGNISLPDGSVLITGGTSRFGATPQARTNYGGANLLAKYSADQSTVEVMGSGLAKKRWYPTNVLMPHDQVVVLGGLDEDGKAVAEPEVVNTITGETRVLSNVNLVKNGVGYSYVRAVAVGANEIMVLSRDSGAAHLFDIRGRGTLTKKSGGLSIPSGPMAPVGNHRFMVAGSYGGRDGVKEAKILQFSRAGVTVSDVPDMSYGRSYHDLTTLPDGSVLATGGSSGLENAAFFRRAERWVAGEGWTPLASASLNRGYHSSAVLLPDATVVKMGSTRPAQTKGEIFYPPYLFNTDGSPRKRPVIESVSRSSTDGRSDVLVSVSGGEKISQVALIRLGSTTHQTPMGDAFVAPKFTQNGQSLVINITDNVALMPAGRYWVFVLDAQETPSVARVITIE